MRVTLWLVVCIAGLPNAAALTFDSPATIEGDAVVLGSSRVFVTLDDASQVEGSFAMPVANRITEYRHHFTQVNATQGPPPHERFIWDPLPESRPAELGDVEAAFRAEGVLAGIIVEAREVMVAAAPTAGTIWAQSRCDTEAMTRHEAVGVHFRERACDGPAVAVTMRTGNATSPTLDLVANGVTRIEFYAFDVTCTSRACVPGGGRSYASPPPTEPVGIQRGYDEYGAIIGHNGTIKVTGGIASVVAIGSPVSASINGLARFPAAIQGPDGSKSSLSVLGRVEVAHIRTADYGAGRLAANVILDDAIVRHDEQILGVIPTAAAAMGVAVLLALMPKVLAGLLTSLNSRKALKHPKRRALMTYIEENPGATFRELLRGTGIMSGTARHHVAVLKRSGMIMEREHKQTHRFFENGGKFEDNWQEVVLLREPELKRLHDWLVNHPRSPQRVILEASEPWGWSRSTTQHRLKRLVDDGLVVIRQQGRMKLHSAAPAGGDLPEPVRTRTGVANFG